VARWHDQSMHRPTARGTLQQSFFFFMHLFGEADGASGWKDGSSPACDGTQAMSAYFCPPMDEDDRDLGRCEKSASMIPAGLFVWRFGQGPWRLGHVVARGLGGGARAG